MIAIFFVFLKFASFRKAVDGRLCTVESVLDDAEVEPLGGRGECCPKPGCRTALLPVGVTSRAGCVGMPSPTDILRLSLLLLL